MPLYRRLPKRGFKNPFRKEYVEVNVGALQQAIDRQRLDAAATVDETALQAAGLFRRRRDGVRLLAKGELTAALTIEVATRSIASSKSRRSTATLSCRAARSAASLTRLARSAPANPAVRAAITCRSTFESSLTFLA